MTQREIDSLNKRAQKRQQKQLLAQKREQALRERAGQAEGRRKAKLLRRAEKQQIRANAHKVRGKQLTQRAAGEINDKEWKRIRRSRRNHWFYDRISTVTRRFQPRNPLREEGMTFQRDGQEFQNQGRIFLGGTKAMNLFTDQAGKQWLCKEAVTCVGTYKPMGALVTEAASKLQALISPKSAIRAFAQRGEDNRVLGSLQEKIDVKEDAFDLFKWQSDTSKPLPAHLPDQILREHVTDWLLCNFDTKGENFLEDASGTLRGIDKEQALSFLDDKRAQHMSYEFSPNPNKTLYNTVFELYAQGKMELNLEQVDGYIRTVESIPNKDYLKLFHDVVKAKCKGDPVRMEQMESKILARKTGLREEYQRFFGELATQRGEKALVDRDGKFSFAAAQARKEVRAPEAPEMLERSKYEKPLTLEESIKAQHLQTQLLRAQQAAEKELARSDLSQQQIQGQTEIKTTAQKLIDLNTKRLTARITPDEKAAFNQLMDPVQAEKSKGTPELVQFTRELQKTMTADKKAEPKQAQAKQVQPPNLTKSAPTAQPKVR